MSYEIKINITLHKIKGSFIPKDKRIKRTLQNQLIPPILDVIEKSFKKNKIEYETIVEVD